MNIHYDSIHILYIDTTSGRYHPDRFGIALGHLPETFGGLGPCPRSVTHPFCSSHDRLGCAVKAGQRAMPILGRVTSSEGLHRPQKGEE
jgi:hypothetical protein